MTDRIQLTHFVGMVAGRTRQTIATPLGVAWHPGPHREVVVVETTAGTLRVPAHAMPGYEPGDQVVVTIQHNRSEDGGIEFTGPIPQEDP